jgi:ribonuclease HII
MVTVGIDEVGRGCWAGPLVAGAVVLGADIPGLKDSKKLTKRQREVLADEIRISAKAIGLGWVMPDEIDAIGLSRAVGLAMQRAITEIAVPFEDMIIDGNINYFPDDPRARAVIKADDLLPAVSAASIIAKVARDTYMSEKAHTQFPAYAFDKHVGYGTKLHIEALKTYGVTPLHRLSYKPIKAFI